MSKILISHPIDPETADDLGLREVYYPLNKELAGVDEPIFYAPNSGEECLYIPTIATKQQPDEEHDPSLEVLRQVLVTFQPDVLIAGNNAVPGTALYAWRQAVGHTRSLRVIRRGVDTRAIDRQAANEQSVSVGNLPGINSPYVARHQVQQLKLNEAQPNSKIAVIGVGNIGKNIALNALILGLDVHLFSPSLQNPARRNITLLERSIPPERVTCAPSLEAAFQDAAYVSVAVPWVNSQGKPNIDMFSQQHLESVRKNARISSASPPRMFSSQALAWMNDQVMRGELYVRIDTAKRLAEEIKQDYPYLDLAHDVAFAASDCQQALDQAMLKQARNFIAQSQNRYASVGA
ncbi:MAG: phosphoglycerate dehydrogenase [Moorea sp. SIO4G2]|uniref:hypothetical protein n=1 Tax=unclassified Moorena TaxID=2683338 RepID=UPI0013CD9211|nr:MULTISPECIES: hypothetical protein [unclassified Moorena]NEO13693.1 phosphoglycerate dehydrogenase [Moorena sp. SIO3E8]NEO24801.1 phosphoglycerate dehydrogenase [Moorena sp. SIO4A5]NEO62822.1 phosphoglycerate dehydrogenase [Moorena sp. SIO4G2]NEP98359.1 phosphoglycerate dehydrogenase [Moorena sp. SIO3F7]